MECILAITGKDFLLTATDTSVKFSISVMKHNMDKSCALNKHNIMLYCGEIGDATQFSEFIQRNIRFYEIKNGIELSPKATANFTRKELAGRLRTRNMYMANVLVGGFDVTTNEPHLYWIDYLGSSAKIPFAAHGYCAYYVLSLMDRYHRDDLSLEEAKALMKKCVDEIKSRFIMNMADFKMKVVDKDGVRDI